MRCKKLAKVTGLEEAECRKLINAKLHNPGLVRQASDKDVRDVTGLKQKDVTAMRKRMRGE